MNSITHFIDADGTIKRKSGKSEKVVPSKGKKGKPMPRKFTTEWGVRYPDGREVCDKSAAGRIEYTKRIIQMWKRDEGQCCICGRGLLLAESTFEHSAGRGFNGSHRDDRIENNGVAHLTCNSRKGSKRA